MNTEIQKTDSNLVVGHLLISNIINKKNRSKSLDRKIKVTEQDVKSDPESYLSKPPIEEIKKLNLKINSTLVSNESAAEILTNLILDRGKLPTISRVVDCMNLISVQSGLTISIWDGDKINGDIEYCNSKGGETYWPFMGEETSLSENELIAQDDEKVLCLVRYRDSNFAPVNLETENIIVHIQGVFDTDKEIVEKYLMELKELLLQNVGGAVVEEKLITE